MSDRAKGLIKLGKPNYCDVCSMPDLFHFNQDLGHVVGAPLGKAWKEAKQAYYKAKKEYGKRKELEDIYLSVDSHRRQYQNGIHAIHKAVLPFNEDGSFKAATTILKVIRESVKLIEAQATYLEKEISEKVILKIVNQIPGLSEGIATWQQWAEERSKEFALSSTIEIRQEELKKWLLHYLLPVFVWELVLGRIPRKKKNERLIQYYKEILQKARDKLKGSKLENYMTAQQYEQCEKWAVRVARTFQRSSSQVEGRNGYLAFVHKANRGMPEQRLQVLTVVHNYDIRRVDGTTPAERLFDRKFPDLFEFVLENVTGFPEPRRRKRK